MVALVCGQDGRASKKIMSKKQMLSGCTKCIAGKRSSAGEASGACLFSSSWQATCLFEKQQSS